MCFDVLIVLGLASGKAPSHWLLCPSNMSVKTWVPDMVTATGMSLFLGPFMDGAMKYTYIQACMYKPCIYRLPSGKESCRCRRQETGDVVSVPGSRRSPGGGNGNPLQYSCLENAMDRGAWWSTVHGVTSWTPLSMHTCMYILYICVCMIPPSNMHTCNTCL